MRRQRGSAYLFVVVCAAVMGLVLASLVPLVTQSRTTENRRLIAAKADLASSSLAEMVASESQSGSIAVGSTRSLTLDGVTATATVSDGSATVANSYLLSGAATAATGDVFKIARYITQGSSTPFTNAIYSASDMTYAGPIVAGASGSNGAVFVNGKINFTSSGTQINGNLSAKADIKLAGGATVTGSTNEKATAVAMPSVLSLNYYNAAVFRGGGTTTTGGVAFGNTTAGNQYPIYYLGGDCSVAGPISGQGVAYIQGNLTVTGNTTYNASTDEFALIVNGNVTFQSGCSQVVGYIFATGSVTVQGSSLNVTRGGIVAKSIVNGSGTLRATFDPFINSSATAATNLSLPGFWP